MRLVMLRALLLSGITLVAGASVTQAQGAGYPVYVGVDQDGSPVYQPCSRNSPPVCTRNDQVGVAPGCLANRSGNIVWCNGLPVDDRACLSPYAGYARLPSSRWTYTHYMSSTASPYFAPGGEAYSYAGYGGFRSVGYGVGTNSPDGAYGTTAIMRCGAEYSQSGSIERSAPLVYPIRAPSAR